MWSWGRVQKGQGTTSRQVVLCRLRGLLNNNGQCIVTLCIISVCCIFSCFFHVHFHF